MTILCLKYLQIMEFSQVVNLEIHVFWISIKKFNLGSCLEELTLTWFTGQVRRNSRWSPSSINAIIKLQPLFYVRLWTLNMFTAFTRTSHGKLKKVEQLEKETVLHLPLIITKIQTRYRFLKLNLATQKFITATTKSSLREAHMSMITLWEHGLLWTPIMRYLNMQTEMRFCVDPMLPSWWRQRFIVLYE